MYKMYNPKIIENVQKIFEKENGIQTTGGILRIYFKFTNNSEKFFAGTDDKISL